MTQIADVEFAQFQHFISDATGINLTEAKRELVTSRLAKRLKHCGVATYGEYFRLLERGDSPLELQMAIDLLTTNETYFFREPKHFAFMREQLKTRLRSSQPPLRVWSAAGSTGEEAYSIAMLLEDMSSGQPWEVLSSDISARVLERAQRGHYSTARTQNIPADYLKRFCRKGEGEYEGTLLIERSLRSRLRFMRVNLNAPLPQLGLFDFIFLRNVLIYFDADTKRKVVARVLNTLRGGGWLLIGHSETLAGVNDTVEQAAPAIFRKPP
jgi:chemotaxis protein methyltransferase CheR